MTLPFHRSIATGICALALLSWVRSAEPAPTAETDADLPQPLDLSTADSLLNSSPFTRTLNLADSLVLTGVAYIDGKPVATIQNRDTKKNYLVSSEPNDLGWKLAETIPSSELHWAEVKVVVGGEMVTIHYGDKQLQPEESKKRPGGSSGSTETYVRDGQTYLRSSYYMNDAQRDRYHAMPNDVREKFRDIIRANSQKLLNAAPQDREAFVKKVFDKFSAKVQLTTTGK